MEGFRWYEVVSLSAIAFAIGCTERGGARVCGIDMLNVYCWVMYVYVTCMSGRYLEVRSGPVVGGRDCKEM